MAHGNKDWKSRRHDPGESVEEPVCYDHGIVFENDKTGQDGKKDDHHEDCQIAKVLDPLRIEAKGLLLWVEDAPEDLAFE